MIHCYWKTVGTFRVIHFHYKEIVDDICFLVPQACGVDYEVKAFCAETLEEKIHKR